MRIDFIFTASFCLIKFTSLVKALSNQYDEINAETCFVIVLSEIIKTRKSALN